MNQRKQNRCTDHQQQIVALCIDEHCKEKVKAVCPLQLYNDHLDHKFQNISKVHSEWGLYSKDAKQVHENISRETMLKYMDGIIEELMFKIKEHLFLLRKELDIKMGMYYNSKAVDKIRSALQGINKCLQERFLDLRHQEIQDSKFFVQIYGMKKLVNDTSTQRQNFQKEILIAFAKIKQEMFMDYPKFNALVKAKEYQYCEIIKAQKTQIAVLKQKLSETSGGLDKITQQHKQLSYEYSRTINQLKNKEATLTETTEKLKIMSQKYNEQAQEAIMKARQIKTKNILGTYPHKHLFRVSDRIIKTGDDQMEWPGLAQVGQAKGKIFVKLTRFDVGSWVLLGVMMKSLVEKNEYQFDNYKTIGHGCYLMDSNRWCYSHSDQDYNCKPLGFQYSHNDVIKVEIFESMIRFSRMEFGWQAEKFQMPFQRKQEQDLFFCIGIKGQHTQIQLV